MGEIKQTIELDCPPGNPRPGDLIGGIIRGTGLPPRESDSRLFGWWTWDYRDIPPKEWKRIRPTLKRRISKLYKTGVVRGGSW
jgi:hypothetical protein